MTQKGHAELSTAESESDPLSHRPVFTRLKSSSPDVPFKLKFESSWPLQGMLKMGRKPREGILHRLPCLVLRVRAMREAQPKGSSNLSSRCAMNGLDEEVWLRSTGNPLK